MDHSKGSTHWRIVPACTLLTQSLGHSFFLVPNQVASSPQAGELMFIFCCGVMGWSGRLDTMLQQLSCLHKQTRAYSNALFNHSGCDIVQTWRIIIISNGHLFIYSASLFPTGPRQSTLKICFAHFMESRPGHWSVTAHRNQMVWVFYNSHRFPLLRP